MYYSHELSSRSPVHCAFDNYLIYVIGDILSGQEHKNLVFGRIHVDSRHGHGAFRPGAAPVTRFSIDIETKNCHCQLSAVLVRSSSGDPGGL